MKSNYGQRSRSLELPFDALEYYAYVMLRGSKTLLI